MLEYLKNRKFTTIVVKCFIHFFKVSCSFFVSVKTCEYLRSRIGFTGKITTERLYTINLAENKIVVQ